MHWATCHCIPCHTLTAIKAYSEQSALIRELFKTPSVQYAGPVQQGPAQALCSNMLAPLRVEPQAVLISSLIQLAFICFLNFICFLFELG